MKSSGNTETGIAGNNTIVAFTFIYDKIAIVKNIAFIRKSEK